MEQLDIQHDKQRDMHHAHMQEGKIYNTSMYVCECVCVHVSVCVVSACVAVCVCACVCVLLCKNV